MTSPVTQITDFRARMRDNMLTQFYGVPVLQAMSDVIADEIQRFEDWAYSVLDDSMLDNAVGLILDRVGAIVRVNRLGRSDADYRKIIQVAIAANNSDGAAEEITWIASQLVNADVRYIQEGQAYFELQYYSDDTLSADLQTEALILIGRAVPSGVAWRLIASEATDGATYDVSTYGADTYGALIGGET